MKKLLLLVAIAIVSLSINAQQKAYESSASYDKKIIGNCVSIDVAIKAKEAQKIMFDLLKNNDLKGKKSGNKIKYEKIAFPAITTDYINMLMSFDVKSNNKKAPITTVNVFIQKGISASFESSSTDMDLITKLKSFLDNQYSQEVDKHNVGLRLDLKNEEIKKSEKSIEKLEKSVVKRNKDIDNYQEKISDAQKDIEKLKREISSVKELLQQQKAELKEIK